ncbi:MAG: lytic transglycosylase domain-containing protein [Spirochaetes bacterium]|nr:lytic transglycosylase domain-containing protein [Spirochaetota bacterium]
MIDNMNKIFIRINEIKSRFGLKPPSFGRKEKSFQDVLNNTAAAQNKISQDRNKHYTIPEIKQIAGEYAKTSSLPPSLVNAVIKTESGYNPAAVSPKGAMGLMQLMPATIRELGISNPFDVRENLSGGVTVLKKLMDKYSWDYRKALAAYNAGEAAVDESGDIPAYKETRDYIKKVIGSYMENAE